MKLRKRLRKKLWKKLNKKLKKSKKESVWYRGAIPLLKQHFNLLFGWGAGLDEDEQEEGGQEEVGQQDSRRDHGPYQNLVLLL